MGAQVTIERRLDWMDTDAGMRWHHSTLWRYVEAAEAEMHRDLGISDITFGFTPRRHLEADFFAPVVFDQQVSITLRVAAVGRTSVAYEVDVASDQTTVATARVVAVFIADEGTAQPWPEAVVAALRDGVAVADRRNRTRACAEGGS